MQNLTFNEQDFSLNVMHYGHESRILPHSHDFCEIVYVEQGFTMHRIREDISLLLSGDIFFIPPGVPHEYWRSTNNIVYNCLFYPQVLGEDISELQKLPMLEQLFILDQDSKVKWSKIHLKPEERYEVLMLLKKIINEAEQKSIGWKVRAKALLVCFLVYLSRVWIDNGISLNNIYSGNSAVPYRILEVMEQCLKSDMTVEDMAKASGYNTEYFSRIFKRLSGISPSAYLTSVKIAAAAELLRDSSLSISKIAELQGYNDVNYFSRIFKKETGKTPTEFKKLI